MKNKLFVVLLFLCVEVSAQNYLRVNNIPGVNVPYTTIQAAIAAAANGDVILVEGSPITYSLGAVTLTKKLTIRGPGFFLNEDITVQASQNPATVSATSFILSTGSDGSVISGLSFITNVEVRTSNITISNNSFNLPNIVNNHAIILSNTVAASNLLISGNYIGTWFNVVASTGLTFTNVILSNNYFATFNNAYANINWSTGLVFATIKNNIFVSAGGNPSNNMSNCDVVNNIFLNPGSVIIASPTNTTIRNNIFVGPSQTNADATNIFNATTANLFIGLSGNTTDTQWKLKTGSVAIGAGASGEDCGIYGGITPYKTGGVGAGLTAISNFTVPASVSQSGTLNVKVSAKVN